MSQPSYTSETPLNSRDRIAMVAAAKGPKPAGPPAAGRKATAAEPATGTPMRPGAYSLTAGRLVLTDERLPGVEIFFELLTSELAEYYLTKRRKRQRKISESSVDRYAGDMVSDQWLFIGDAIRFNSAEELVDGQHRCRAVSETGVPQMTRVVGGQVPEASVVFDTGRPRTFAGQLQTEGIANACAVASLTKRVLDWRRGNYAVTNIGRIPNPPALGIPASPSKLYETFLDLRDPIQHATKRGIATKAGFATKTASPSVLSFAYLLFGILDLDRCERFFYELQKGPDRNNPEYPIFVLRERMKKRVPEGQPGLPDWVWLHFLFTTWNKWYRAESMGALRTPARAAYGHVALPEDPYADTRPDRWDPLGGITA